MRFTVAPGVKYRATLKLTLFESLASNDMIKGKFESMGFGDVVVSGSGRERVAEGVWKREQSTAKVPRQVVSVQTIYPELKEGEESNSDGSVKPLTNEEQKSLPAQRKSVKVKEITPPPSKESKEEKRKRADFMGRFLGEDQ